MKIYRVEDGMCKVKHLLLGKHGLLCIYRKHLLRPVCPFFYGRTKHFFSTLWLFMPVRTKHCFRALKPMFCVGAPNIIPDLYRPFFMGTKNTASAPSTHLCVRARYIVPASHSHVLSGAAKHRLQLVLPILYAHTKICFGTLWSVLCVQTEHRSFAM